MSLLCVKAMRPGLGVFLARIGCSLVALGLLLAGPRADAALPKGADSLADANATPTPPPPAALVGAIWVGATGGANFREVPRTDQLIQDLRALPFGEVIIQVRVSADAYYVSKLVPKALGVAEHFDPLAALLTGLHGTRGAGSSKRVIAWFFPYKAGNVNSAVPVAAEHVLTAHPDWLSVRADGSKTDKDGNMYLEPGLPEVQQHLEEVVKELVRNYRIDGIYFDPVSDPDSDWGYHPAVIQEWLGRSGKQGKPDPEDPDWIAYRTEVLKHSLEGLARAARAARPRIMVAAGASTDGPNPPGVAEFRQTVPYTRFHQDWPQWLLVPGLLNRLYVKDFKPDESGSTAFNGWMKLALELEGKQNLPTFVGVAGSMNESIDALAQLRRVAEAGARGFALADYAQPVLDVGSRSLFMNAIAHTVLSEDYLRTLAAGHKTLKALAPPGLSATETSATEAAATPAPKKTIAALPAPAPAERQSTLTRPRPAAAPKTEPGSEFELPPPPPANPGVPEVQNETAETSETAALEPAEGRLHPIGGEPATRVRRVPNEAASPASGEAAAQEAEIRAFKSLTEKSAPSTPHPAERAKPKPAPAAPQNAGPILTRQEMLDELINDPQFTQTREWNLLRPDDQATEYLKKNYKNIF